MVTLNSLLLCAPELETQLCLLVIHAVFWKCFIALSSQRVFGKWAAAQLWKNEWVKNNQRSFKNTFFVEFPEDQVFDVACELIAVLCQHGVGGALCIPSVLGYTGPIVWAMACHGALCEAGWELQDTITHAYEIVCGGERGRAKNPPAFLLLLAFHHAMGLSMVIPMNLHHNTNSHYHEFVFLLQFAAFAAILSQQYGFTLDVKTARDLGRMQIAVAFTWLVLGYSRGIRYGIVGWELLQVLWVANSPWMLYMGSVAVTLMGLLNVMLVLDGTAKLRKFWGMKPPAAAKKAATSHTAPCSSAKGAEGCSLPAQKARQTRIPCSLGSIQYHSTCAGLARRASCQTYESCFASSAPSSAEQGLKPKNS